VIRRLTYANVMSTLALFVALGGGAFAAGNFVATNGVVRLCVPGNGVAKVLKVGQKCGKGKRQIPINQTGPQGLRGPQGPQGPLGPQGPPGSGGSASYTAGAGLTLTGNTFGADLSQLQARIGACPPDQALQSVSQAGTPACVGLHAYSMHGGSFNPRDTATVNVPAGNWVVMAQDTISPAKVDTVVCDIEVNGTNVIASAIQGSPPTVPPDTTVTAIGTTTTTSSSTPIDAVCQPSTTSISASTGALILAIPVAALN
jgi:hypothetical protein